MANIFIEILLDTTNNWLFVLLVTDNILPFGQLRTRLRSFCLKLLNGMSGWF